ncbi:MAG: FtsQ-type POTRA domain-containing protein [Actinobacteria bacterium]|nr:FtsQ-type POTRA domain-containing protein [Actinomycetota bacterium]MBW3647613.1 FtsQ-type POTRA domain-containing protein [Actinomycetota bacterium]
MSDTSQDRSGRRPGTTAKRRPAPRTALARTAPTGPARPVPTGPAPAAAAPLRLAVRLKAQRRARRRRLARRVGQALLVVLPLAGIAWVLLLSSWLAVDSVEVTGTARLTVAEVQAVAGVREQTPLARVDLGGLEAAVGRLAPVARVEASRSWPGTLRVQVTERTPVAGVPGPGAVALVDVEGVVFATASELPAGLVRLEVDSPGADDAATGAALKVYRDLPAELRADVRTVRADSASSVQLLLGDGRQVVWGPSGRTATKAAAVAALRKLPGTVIDVSAPGLAVRR